MKTDIILCGVGGQGVLSIAVIIAKAAVSAGLTVRQSEVHGMAQRGGAVLAHLRISDKAILSDLVPKGSADIIISMEPVESLRYTSWLKPEGILISAAEPFINIPDYPDIDSILQAIRSLPKAHAIEAAELAKQAGMARAVNMVMVGAASHYLPVSDKELESTICELFATKEPSVIEANTRAFRLGRASAES